MPARPKTGEKRQTRQPLKIDKLPMEVRDEIQQLRVQGKTWLEIEELSAKFVKWDTLPTRVLELFPEMRLPHSSLQRWYDLRVDQVKTEMLADQVRAREIATMFAGQGFKDLPEAVRNALGDKVFSLMQSADDKTQQKTLKGLLELGWLLAQQRKLELQERKQQTDERALQLKIDAMREKVAALKKDVDGTGKKRQLSPEELKKRVDEIYGLAA
jgi:hypothetical protein